MKKIIDKFKHIFIYILLEILVSPQPQKLDLQFSLYYNS